ncbi:MAG TPA: phosphatase PAP2 family protein [Ilumatobacter sp.]|nr:phosphatase PAP2 family protein [Ilumatobacter sp.]
MTESTPPGGRRPGRHLPLAWAWQMSLIAMSALLYFGVRGLTEGSAADAIENGYGVLRLEAWFGIDIEESFQGVVLASRALTDLANWVYIWGHWPVIVATLLWLHRRHHDDFVVLRNAMFVSGAIGLVVFAIHPVAPPRHLPDRFVDTVTEWSRAYRVLQPPQLVNEYAAVPSLHVGWNLLIGIFLVRVGGHVVVRVLGVVGPALMALAVVATGNHYVIDGLIGAVVALVGLAASRFIWRTVYAPRLALAADRHVVEDQAIDAPGDEVAGALGIVDSPGEHGAVPRQAGDDALGHEPVVDRRTVRRPPHP